MTIEELPTAVDAIELSDGDAVAEDWLGLVALLIDRLLGSTVD